MDNKTLQEVQKLGSPPLAPDHTCFSTGHAMFTLYTLHNHQSSWGQHKCSRCGYLEDWQYDFVGSNPNVLPNTLNQTTNED